MSMYLVGSASPIHTIDPPRQLQPVSWQQKEVQGPRNRMP